MTQTVYFQFAIASIPLVPITAATQLADGGAEVVLGSDFIENGVDTGMPSFWASSIFSADPISDPLGAYYQINMVPVAATLTAPPNLDNIPVNLADPSGNLLSISVSGVPQWRAVTVPDGYILPTFGAPLDTGPTASDLTGTVVLGKSIDLTTAILAAVTPGATGDTDTLTSVGSTSSGGTISLVNGDVTYTGLSDTLRFIPANGSMMDSFTYTVANQLGQTTTGTVTMTVTNPVVTFTGTNFGRLGGWALITTGPQANIINTFSNHNTIHENAAYATVNTGAGDANVSISDNARNVVVNLGGEGNALSTGTGTETINESIKGDGPYGFGTNQFYFGAGHVTFNDVYLGSQNDFYLFGATASINLNRGVNDLAYISGGTDDITDDNGTGLTVEITKVGGSVTLHDFLTDKRAVVDLLGGVGGYNTAKAVVAALQSDGNGGTMLSLGAAGHIDFAGVPVGTLKAASFHIG